LIVVLIIGLVIIAGILVFIVLKPSPSKCGDGICDATERAHPDACPEDCEEIEIETCSQQAGEICNMDEKCVGTWLDASDSEVCCSGSCEITIGAVDIVSRSNLMPSSSFSP